MIEVISVALDLALDHELAHDFLPSREYAGDEPPSVHFRLPDKDTSTHWQICH